jgi:hypothetical protein
MTRDRSRPDFLPRQREPTDRRSITWARFAPRRDLQASDAVVDAVAAAERRDPRCLRSDIEEALDTDALDSLFSNGSTHARLSFRYGGYVVDVRGDGWVRVRIR